MAQRMSIKSDILVNDFIIISAKYYEYFDYKLHVIATF